MVSAWGPGTASAIARWWPELTEHDRLDVLALTPESPLPEMYIVDLLLYGAHPPLRLSPHQEVRQPLELRAFIRAELDVRAEVVRT